MAGPCHGNDHNYREAGCISLPGLIYSNIEKSFTTDWWSLWEPIRGVEFEIGKHGGKWSPDFYFNFGSKGYELGLEVSEGWWQQICAASGTGEELAKIERFTDFRTGMTRLSLEILPYSEFDHYIEFEHKERRRRKQEEARNQQVAHSGWKREPHDPEHLSKVNRIQHKYFSVEHWAI